MVNKKTFANVFKIAYTKTVERNLCPMAFRKSGIFPADLSNVSMEKIVASPTLLPSPEPPTPPACPPGNPFAQATANSSTALSDPVSPSPAPSTSEITPSTSSEMTPSTSSKQTPSTSSEITQSTSSKQTQSTSRDGNISAEDSLKSTARKFAMLCNQMAASELNDYFDKIEDESTGEPRFELFKVYLMELTTTKRMDTPAPPMVDPLKHPLPQARKASSRTRRATKMPDFMSGEEFISILVERDQTKADEERRKAERKVEMEQKKKQQAKEKEEKEKKRKETEQQRKVANEKKKMEKEKKRQESEAAKKRKAEEAQLRKIMEESKRKRKASSASDTSVEDDMELDSDSDGMDGEESDDSLWTAISTAVSDGGTICPVCNNSSNEQTEWIQCESCSAWFHYNCVKNVDLNVMTQNEIEDLSSFYCDFCV